MVNEVFGIGNIFVEGEVKKRFWGTFQNLEVISEEKRLFFLQYQITLFQFLVFSTYLPSKTFLQFFLNVHSYAKFVSITWPTSIHFTFPEKITKANIRQSGEPIHRESCISKVPISELCARHHLIENQYKIVLVLLISRWICTALTIFRFEKKQLSYMGRYHQQNISPFFFEENLTAERS